MIKTKFFADDGPHCQTIDDQINTWLSQNQDIKLIDIKFQSNVSAVADSGVSAEYWHTSALVVYNEPPKQTVANSKGTGFLIKCDKCGEVSAVEAKHAGQSVCYECKGEKQ